MEEMTSKKKKVKAHLDPEKTPILYTDNLSLTANDDGVVINAIQKFVKSEEGQVVARIGMSREHAKKLINKLGKILLMTEPSLKDKKLNN